MRIQQMLRGQRLPPIPHLLSVMVQPKQVSSIPLRMSSKQCLGQQSQFLSSPALILKMLCSQGSTPRMRGKSCARMRSPAYQQRKSAAER